MINDNNEIERHDDVEDPKNFLSHVILRNHTKVRY